jgi:outer membrane protein OmpA-like peptidoglycan-associated protein
MNKPIPLLACLLAVWMTGIAYYQSQTSCACNALSAQSAATAASGSTLSFVDASKNINIDISGQLLFEVGKYQVSSLTDAAKANLGQITQHLKNNPDRTLQITGLYNLNELNESKYGNLGIARAEVVKSLLLNEGCPDKQITVNQVSGEVKNHQATNFEGVEFLVK